MPALSNPRCETFCHNVAAGMSGAEALRQAGGGGTAAANGAYRLQRPEVKARIQELKRAVAEQAQATITERAAVAAGVKIGAEVRSRVRTLGIPSSRPASECWADWR